MKRFLYILLLLPFGVAAQNMYNVSSLLENGLIGTARYVGMGGAMSALGADLSTMGTNPAGMALFRSSDVAFTMGLDLKSNEATYEGTALKSKDAGFFVGNTSFVFSLEGNGEKLKFLNLGIGYRRKNNLSNTFEMYGASNGYSQQYIIDNLYRAEGFDYTDPRGWMYKDFAYSWLTLLAAEAYLGDSDGNFLTYPDTTLVWYPNELGYYEEMRGGVNVVDFNISANIDDRLYLGATVGFSLVDYNRYSEYREVDDYGDIYVLENNKNLTGRGLDLKLGLICRPFKYSPFKIGFSVHTPTWYDLNEHSSATITDPDGRRFSTTDAQLYNDMLSVKSRLRSPWRFNASMSYTFGTYLALDAEYEYADYRKSQFMGRGDVEKCQNSEFGYNMEAQHIVRAGAELNIDGFALRAGYNYLSAPFKKSAYKDLYNAAITETSTEYMNYFDKNVVTLGCGWRKGPFYLDLAYMLEMQNSEFYPFDDYPYGNPGATVKHTNHSVIATVGMRF